MNRSFIFSLLLCLPLVAFGFYGKRSTEAELVFQAQVDVPLADSVSLQDLNRNGRARSEALALIDAQAQHLMGSFQARSFRDQFGYPGVLGERYEIKFNDIKEIASEDSNRKMLFYEFKGTVVFHKDAFKNSATRVVPIVLPLAPDKIYALGVVDGKNTCTDEHYNSEGDFWYFWDPEQSGCPLAGDTENILHTKGKLKRLPNTRASYPEYDRLYGDNGNDEVLNIAVFFGYFEDVTNFQKVNPHDSAFDAFNFLESNLLEKRGFTVKESKDDFQVLNGKKTTKGINTFRAYEKQEFFKKQPVTVRVQVLVADTAIDSKDGTFHRYLKAALRSADILIYDGHSGLGGNLDLKELKGERFDKNKYQILFFNGCSSYPYFNGMFFNAKGGSQNLDILTSGLPTFSNTAGPNVVAFLNHFIEVNTKTYQKILTELEDSNAEEGTYLTGVNGDEDNKWKP